MFFMYVDDINIVVHFVTQIEWFKFEFQKKFKI